MKDNSYNDSYSKEEEDGIDFQALIGTFVMYWKWFVASVIICLAIAFVYLRYTTPVYKITTKIMIKDNKKGGYTSEMVALEDLGFLSSTGGIDNEIEVLQSKSLVKDAIIDMKLYTTYIEKGRIGKHDLYKASPILVDLSHDKVADLERGYQLTITTSVDSVFHIKCETFDDEGEEVVIEQSTTSLPYLLETPFDNLIISRNLEIPLTPDKKLLVSITPPLKMAKAYLAALTVEPTSKTTSVALLSLTNTNKQRGEDFLNKLIEIYNNDANEDKNQVARKTEAFIEERIAIVSADLNKTEGNLQDVKQKSGLVNLASDAEQALKEASDYKKKLVDVNTQLALIQSLSDHIFNPNNHLELLPANTGLTNASLTGQIDTYNKQILERNRLMRSASESNPAVVSITTLAEGLLDNIKQTIVNVKKDLEISRGTIEREVNRFDNRVSNAPKQERVLGEIMRQQEIKAGLYLMLLQKREENSIALAATADNAKIIDDALAEERPISPKRSMIMLIAFVIGVGIPVGILYLINLLNYKISGRADVEKLTKGVNILGEIPRAKNIEKGQRSVVVKQDSNDLMAETFRAVRTNLNFILSDPQRKVVLFTSTTSGEGKTFISSNLAVSLALLGKKVILCGLDIRKPRLVDLFNLTDKTHGITTFLAGDAKDKDLLFNQVMNSGVNPNLDLLPAGIIPPNPAELLAKENLDKAIEYLSEKYDYIILDTAPVGLVSDTLLIGRVASASIYVCRADYTPKSDLEYINDLHESKKLPNISVIINDIDIENSYYGYGRYGYRNSKRYGYGYSYGYGLDSEKQPQKRFKK
ncbi:MAG: polysaccharide biosynthesis tyrosine autokinase [Bacteroidaceae bacterium]|nr:polysaccharide biosynthesis tyrosine autokinase [Bacteroidaceae bacterium]